MASVVVDSEHFYVGIQDGSLSVMSVPVQYIPHCAWCRIFIIFSNSKQGLYSNMITILSGGSLVN